MNTLKFLAVGSSLDSGRDVVGRYRVREASLLPRFDPDAESALTSAIAPSEAQSWWRRILGLFRSPATPLVTTREVADLGEPTNSFKPGNREPGQREMPVASTAATITPLTDDGAREQVRKPVQHEFRFENVTVVCNDLHDADIEIVTMPRGRRSPAKAMDQLAALHA